MKIITISMGFNGIKGEINVPGEIPWEIVVVYFVLALFFVFYIGKKYGGLKQFTTLDLVYIAVGAALGVAWEFYIGSYLGRVLPSSPFIGVGFWGRILIILIFVGLVRKVGSGMLSLLIYNILSDLFHYGFGGEPIFTIYETLTYGLFIDLMIALTGGKIFGIGLKPSNNTNQPEEVVLKSLRRRQTILAVVEGIVLGILFAIPDPIFYLAFFRPFLYGAIVNWQTVTFDLIAFIPGDVIITIIAGLLALRVSRAVGQ